MKPTSFIFLSALLALLLISFAAANDATQNDDGANQVTNEKQSYGGPGNGGGWVDLVVGGVDLVAGGADLVVDGVDLVADGADVAVSAAAAVVMVEGASGAVGQLKKH
ncbi:hypothetical protein Salat_2932100 [Sesamum alatum]|uniref:Uncharacterized protein n=1 Tax=Sesamum alatum TaxID=300844 RepID=A0AAE2C8D6_9LAMI|nr:hypothetical protein Salat_2932100 [Sesamum alatum]